MTRGNFFAIDRRAWHYVCDLDDINPAMAYLVQARGTGVDNRTTAWSTHAVEQYTPMARSRAKEAIELLIKAKATKQISSSTRPRYKLAPPHEIPAIVEAAPLPDHDYFADPPPNPVSKEPQWIWLPNELVTSTGAAGELPPICLVHNTGDPMLLRLLVDLYDAQNLVDNGGVSFREVIWQKYFRVEIGLYAEFVIYGFLLAGGITVRTGSEVALPHMRDLSAREKKAGEDIARDFWRRLARLTELGLVEWVPHLVTNDSDRAEIIHVYADDLAELAHRAARSALTLDQRARADTHGHKLAPLRKLEHEDAQMIGVLRMRYRAKSSLTAAWIAINQQRREVYVAIYEGLLSRCGVEQIQAVQHQGYIKVRSR
jgi:hypothetical protein